MQSLFVILSHYISFNYSWSTTNEGFSTKAASVKKPFLYTYDLISGMLFKEQLNIMLHLPGDTVKSRDVFIIVVSRKKIFSKSAIWDKGFVLLWSPITWGPDNCETSSVQQRCANWSVFQRKYDGYSQRKFFCCKVMAADSWKPFQGLSQQHRVPFVCQSIREQTGAVLRDKWETGKRDGEEPEEQDRKQSRFVKNLFVKKLERPELQMGLSQTGEEGTKAIQNAVKAQGCATAALQESDELKLNSWGASKHVLCHLHQLQGCCPACPPVWSLIWNRRSLNLSVSGNGYLTQFFQTLIASLFFLILS